jgi:hypothetical protein
MKRLGAVPVVLAGLEKHAITGPDHLDWPAAALCETDALGHVDGLTVRVHMPRGPCARSEVNAARVHARDI